MNSRHLAHTALDRPHRGLYVRIPMSHYVIGQRWLSDAEPELGLGVVSAVDVRRVEIRFPASNETRLFAVASAPLRRVRFAAGDQVCGPDGRKFAVESVEEDRGLLTYIGRGRRLPESELQDTQRYDRPEQRLFAGQADSWLDFDLRLETHQRRHDHMRSPVRGFVGGRAELIPHQLYIAHEVARRELPRVLLADEVGLGKTIEAGLILHRLLVTGRIGRVLIVVPDALIHQWFIELLRRFSLSFRIYDFERCGPPDEDAANANPFADEQLVLCGMKFLADNPLRAAQAVQAGWDLLVVDEAHRLRWSPKAASPGYQLAEALARYTPGLLLLTATPEQLGVESHYARLRLLDPDRYPSMEKYMAERAGYEAVARKTRALLDRGDESGLQELLDRHGPGRVMFRNTRAAMPGFPKRHLHKIPLAPPEEGDRDPRLRWLADFLRKHPKTKVLAICETRDEVQEHQDILKKLIEVKTALFHEDMPLLQCDRQAAWFAEPEGARLLIASAIGGEGRNFQFVQHLVLLGLPDDPEMLEQRIGRLDRIGQTGDIHIHVPYITGTPEEGRLRWYHEGLDAFATPLSGAFEIVERFEDRLAHVDDELITDTKKFRKALRARIDKGRDRLLELSSFRPVVAQQVVEAIAKVDVSREIEDYLLRLFDRFGVHAEHLTGRDYLLVPGHTFDTAFPLGAEPLRITCDRRQAIAREDITLMTWDHPLLTAGMDLLLGSERGNCALAAAAGLRGFLLQAVFVLECVVPPKLEAVQFLPPTPVSILLNHEGREVAQRPARLHDGPSWQMSEAPAGVTERLRQLLETARRKAESAAPALRERARAEMRERLGGELKRLRDLRKVNDHVREEEIAALEQRIAALDTAFARSALRLDAVLLILPGDG